MLERWATSDALDAAMSPVGKKLPRMTLNDDYASTMLLVRTSSMTAGAGADAAEALRRYSHIFCNFWIKEDVSAVPVSELAALVMPGHGPASRYAAQIAAFRSAPIGTRIVTGVKNDVLYGTLTGPYRHERNPAIAGHPHLRRVAWDTSVIRGKKVDINRAFNLLLVPPERIVANAHSRTSRHT